MKDNIKILGKAAAFVAAAGACFLGLYVIVDVALNRRFADWFESSFFIDMGIAYWSNGGRVHVYDFRWPVLKRFLLPAGMLLAMVWALTIVGAAVYAQKMTEKRTTKTIGRMLRQYFAPDSKPVVFPKKYAEIADHAASLKEHIQRNEQMLLAESQRKNDLIAYLAHDLKTPLTSVIGYLSLLKEAPEMPAEQKAKYVGIALEKALRLETLINEFFDITRYNLHQIVLEEESLDVSYMLLQMADEFYPLLEQQGKSISIDAGEDMTITADPAKLARVFNNVLKNAIAYSYANTTIEVQAKKQEDRIRVSVTNFGKPIPKQKLDVIFEKFYRLDDARSTNTGGAGLGLAIAKEIVTAHGGTIAVTSEKQITTFTVELPAGNSELPT